MNNPILTWQVRSGKKVLFEHNMVTECYKFINDNNLKTKPKAKYGTKSK